MTTTIRPFHAFVGTTGEAGTQVNSLGAWAAMDSIAPRIVDGDDGSVDTGSDGSGTLTLTLPDGAPDEGDLLLVFSLTGSGSSRVASTPTGFASIASVYSSDLTSGSTLQVFAKVAGSSESASVTLGAPSYSAIKGQFVRVVGAALEIPSGSAVATTKHPYANGSSTLDCPSVTVATDSSLVLPVWGSIRLDTTVSPPDACNVYNVYGDAWTVCVGAGERDAGATGTLQYGDLQTWWAANDACSATIAIAPKPSTLYVDTDGTVDGDTCHALTLDAAIDLLPTTWDRDYVIECKASSGTADTTAVSISGFTENGYRLTAQAASGHEAQASGYSTSKYRLEVIGTDCISTSHPITLEGLQIRVGSSGAACYGVDGATNVLGLLIDRCRIGGLGQGNGLEYGTIIRAGGTLTVRNSIYEGGTDGHDGIFCNGAGATIQNCTITGWGDDGISGTADEVRNCAIFNNLDDVQLSVTTFEYNAGDDSDFASGTGNIQPSSWTDVFNDHTSGDFTLKSTAGSVLGGGAILSDVVTDMDGKTRKYWDMGVSEYHTTATEIDLDTGGLGDYSSLSAVITALPTSWTTDYVVTCRASGGAADTTEVDMTGFTTRRRRFTLQAHADHRASIRKWDTGKYRLDTATASVDGFKFQLDYITIDGLQIRRTGSGPYLNALEIVGDSGVIKNCRVHDATPSYTSSSAVSLSACTNFLISNCVIVSETAGGYSGIEVGLSTPGRVYNCVVYYAANQQSWAIRGHNAGNNPNVAIRNCALVSYGADIRGCSDIQYCATADGYGEERVRVTNWSSEFVNPTLTATGDFRLKPSSSLMVAGVDLSSDITDDLEGTTRSNWDIGAYEHPGTLLVDTDGVTGDYSSLDAAVDDLETSFSRNWVIECQATTGTADTAAVRISGFTENGYGLTIQAASGHEARASGWDATRYRLEASDTNNYGALHVNNESVSVLGLQVKNTDTTNNFRQTITAYKTNALFDGLYVQEPGGQSNNCGFEIELAAGGVATCRNTIIVGGGDGDGFYGNVVTDSSGGIKLHNCVIRNFGEGVKNSGWDIDAQNCAVFDCADDFSGSFYDIDYCASDDGDGTNSVSPTDWSTVFEGHTTGDFRLKFGSELTGAGTDLSAYFTTDIDGNTRDLYDIGASQATEGYYLVDTDGSSGTHATMDAAIDDLPISLSRNWVIECQATTGVADTTAVSISGITHNNYSLRVEAASGHGAVPNGWDTGRYRLSVSTAIPLTLNQAGSVLLKQLQVEQTSNSAYVAVSVASACTTTVLDGLYVRQSGTHTSGHGVQIVDSAGDIQVRNCIAFRNANQGIARGFASSALPANENYFYNCVSSGWNKGFYTLTNDSTLTNCAALSNVDDLSDVLASWTLVTYCATEDGDDNGNNGNIAIVSAAATFEDPSNGDFRLKSNDTNLIGAGTDLSAYFTTDMAGNTRDLYDIGASQATEGYYLVDTDGSSGTHATMDAAIDDLPISFSRNWVIECQATTGAADTTKVWFRDRTMNGHSLTVRAASGHEAQASGWKTDRYRLDVNDTGSGAFITWELDTFLEGLQVRMSGSIDPDLGTVIFYADRGGVDNCRIVLDTTSDYWGSTIVMSSDISFTLRNSLFLHEGTGTGQYNVRIDGFYADIVIDNCLVYGGAVGIKELVGGQWENDKTFRNTVVFNTDDDISVSTGLLSTTYCAGDDADFATGTGNIQPSNWADVFVDHANGDFRLWSTDTDLTEGGTDLSGFFTTDIKGTTRPINTNWDIGPWENDGSQVPVGGSIPPIAMSFHRRFRS